MAETVATIGLIFGTASQAIGALRQGQAERTAARYEARQLESAAEAEQATAQRKAIEERRKARLLASRAQAVAASSGGGGTDPTVVNLISDLEGEGEYNALAALYEGDTAASSLRAKAGLRRYEGRQAKTAGYLKAATAVGGGLYDKYG